MRNNVLCMVCLLIFFLGCSKKRSTPLLTVKVKKEDFSIEIKERGELKALREKIIRVPPIYQRLKIGYVVEEGIKVKKGQRLVTLHIDKVWTRIRKWKSEIKLAKLNLDVAKKKLALETSQLNSRIKKLKLLCKQKKIILELEKIHPGAKKSLESYLAIKESNLKLIHRKQELSSQEYLADKKLSSHFELFKRRLEYMEEAETNKEKKLDYKVLHEVPDVIELAKLKSELNKEVYNLRQAENDLKYKIISLKADVSNAEKNLYIHTNNLKMAQKAIAMCTIKSPSHGVVIHKRVWTGSGKVKVKRGVGVWAFQSLLSVQDMDKMLVVAEVSEKYIHKIYVKQKVIMNVDSIQDRVFPGEIIKIKQIAQVRKANKDQETDEKKERFQEKVFEVFIQLKDKDSRFKPGLTGNVRILCKKIPGALTLPLLAIFHEGKKPYVYVKRNGKVVKQKVLLGISDSINIVIKEGVEEGELVYIELPQKEKNISGYENIEINGKTISGIIKKVIPKKFLKTIIETGITQPFKSEIIRAKINGNISKLPPEGTFLKKGDIALTIEKIDEGGAEQMKLQRESSRAQLAKYQSELDLNIANQELEVKKAFEDVALAKIELQYFLQQPFPYEIKKIHLEIKRAELAFRKAQESYTIGQKLFKSGVLSSAKLSQRKLEEESRKAALNVVLLKRSILLKGVSKEEIEIAKEKLRLLKVKYEQTKKTSRTIINKYKATLNVVKKHIAQKNHELDYMERANRKAITYSNIDGYVRYYPGKPAEIGQTCYESESIFEVNTRGKTTVKIKINQVDRNLLRAGQKAKIHLLAYPGKVLSGKVLSISKVANDRDDDGLAFVVNKNSGIMIFEGVIEVLSQDIDIKNGMSASVEIVVKKEDKAIMVERTAIVKEKGKYYLYKKELGILQKTEIIIGESNRSYVIVKQGLKDGEMYFLPSMK